MKKAILLSLAMLYICMGIVMFLIGSEFLFVEKVMNGWPMVLIAGIAVTLITLLSKRERIERNFLSSVIVFPLGLIVIAIIFSSNIPRYSVQEAAEMIQIQTGFEVEMEETMAQLGTYYLHTSQGVYLFNSENGDFVKR